MPSQPYAIRADIAALWTNALEVASDGVALWLVRRHAASICLLLAAEVDSDDALALTAVAVASTMIECAPYTRLQTRFGSFASTLLLLSAARVPVADEGRHRRASFQA